ncbi:hypothetical protein J7E99_33605 [Streptomyces sp. ISL-44]|uniref:hypothetical protein n=1 Tax=Streptomyces sp. ISL-44 TaxID=2819184 RepID=UPI001BE806EA|nr:hypothetical protein [Streptomyces sp. ISL-44]
MLFDGSLSECSQEPGVVVRIGDHKTVAVSCWCRRVIFRLAWVSSRMAVLRRIFAGGREPWVEV